MGHAQIAGLQLHQQSMKLMCVLLLLLCMRDTTVPAPVPISEGMHAGLPLHQQSMDLMRALLLLEDRLYVAMEFEPREPWGLMRALEPALFKWTVDKLELLQGWMQRLMSVEEWKPVTTPQGCARSALSGPPPCGRGDHPQS